MFASRIIASFSKLGVYSCLIISIVSFSSCKEIKVQSLPGSSGKTCEIMIVCDKADYEGTGIRDSIRAFFMEIQPGLNQPEPRFTVAHILPEAFKNSKMFTHHRNILNIEIDEQYASNPVVEAGTDVWSAPQVVYKFSVGNVAQFDSLFKLRKNSLMKAFYAKEYVRIQKVFKKSQDLELKKKLESRYGYSLIFPEGFELSAFKPDFAWVRKESKHSGQGLLIYTYPYTDDSTFSSSNIIKRRNEAASRVSGPADGSYMITETAYPEFLPTSAPINMSGLYAVETRGLWRLEGDFMGGPFVNYVFVDTATKKVIMLDAYLYSPRKPKRDLLMQMEAIARSFKFVSEK